jgi:PAS domain S-box-containing protein
MKQPETAVESPASTQLCGLPAPTCATLLAADGDDFVALAALACAAPVAALFLDGVDHVWCADAADPVLGAWARRVAWRMPGVVAGDLLELYNPALDLHRPELADAGESPAAGCLVGVALGVPPAPAIGLLCVLDRQPRHLSTAQRDGLRALARQITQRVVQTPARGDGVAQALGPASAGGDDRSFRTALERLDHVAVQAYGEDGTITFWNRASETLYGYSAGEAIGRDLVELLLPPEARAAERALLARIAGGQAPAASETEVLRSDGSTAMVYSSRILVEPANGPRGFFCFDVDITARRRAESALRVSEARYRAIAQNIPGAVIRYLLHPDGHHSVEFMSPGCVGIWELEPAAFEQDAMLLWSAIVPEDREAMRASLLDSASALTLWTHDWRIVTPSGQHKRLHTSSFPTRRSNGVVVWDGVVFDVTERHAAQAAIALSEARLRILTEAAPEAIVVLDVDAGHLVEFNGKACTMFGLSPAQLTARNPADLSPERQPDGRLSLDAAGEYIGRAAAGEEPVFEWLHQAADGRQIPCEVHLVRLPDATRVLVRGSLIDISARQRAERALRDSEQRFRSLVEDIETIAVQGYDRQRRITFWNHASELLYGYPAGEALGQRIEDLIIPTHLREAVAATVDRWIADGKVSVTSENLILKHRDGTPLPVFSSHIMQTNGRGEPELYCLDVDLRELRRTEAALQRANETLQQRNHELQQFVMVASHDLQEPLRKVQTFGDRLQSELGERLAAAERDHLERMIRAAGRMRDLIQDLLDYSSVSGAPGVHGTVDLGEIVAGVLDDLEAEIAQAGATISVGPLPTVSADAIQMRQLFQNVIGNALKYRVAERAPRISVDSTVMRDETGSTRCSIRVADNGIGFDPQFSERIFAPFQRLHARSEYTGTGIGLAIVRKIVERHDGTVVAHGRPGEGAEFTITLPLGP